MWERTLQDLIRGLRANKGDQNKFVQRAVDEIRQEITSKDMHLKAAAVLKLTYLDMLGYDMSWASFHVVEVMSSPKYHLKNIGHLAACLSFTQQTDVLMLTTNLLKKDLAAPPVELSLTLNTLSHILTPDLARDLGRDLVSLLTHSRAHIRKRAVVAVFNVFDKYPDLVPHAFNRLRAQLDDPDPGVVIATVNVITELARRDPASYLSLAPQLFHVLTTSSNNWVLIKVMKLFACLAPLEPRLAKKLQGPMSDLIATTPAISLLYECVRTCITGDMLSGPSGRTLARSCVEKLAAFLQDEDQNLKYIALLALVKIVPSHPHLVAEYEEMIMASIDEPDISIRMRALDLVSAMATPDNLQSIISRLLGQLTPVPPPLPSASSALAAVTSPDGPAVVSVSPNTSPSYRSNLTHLILSLSSREMYSLVSDFQWYLSVLTDLAYISNAPGVGKEIARQMVDICVRVKATRRFGVQLMARLLGDDNLLLTAKDEGSCSEVLGAAAWICGEYCRESSDLKTMLYHLVQPSVALLPANALSIYIHNALKIFGFWAADLANRWDMSDLQEVKRVVDMILGGVERFTGCNEIEVQERAANMLQLFTFIRADIDSYQPNPNVVSIKAGSDSESAIDPSYPKSLFLIRPLFSSYELNAVAPAAQIGVVVPEGLDLETWIVRPERDTHDDLEDDGEETRSIGRKGKGREADLSYKEKGTKRKKKAKRHEAEFVQTAETQEEQEQRARKRAERLERLKDDPYYIVDDRTSSSSARRHEDDIDSIPVVRLDGISLPTASTSAIPLPSVPSTSSQGPSAMAVAAVIDLDGKMPVNVRPYASQEEARTASPVRPSTMNGDATETTLPPQPYELPEEGVSTPEPIRVTRIKKSTKKKKKREEGT